MPDHDFDYDPEPERQTRHSWRGLTCGDRVRVLGLLTHRHGEVGTVERIELTRDRNPYEFCIRFGPYCIRLDLSDKDVSWFNREALQQLDVIELLAELAK